MHNLLQRQINKFLNDKLPDHPGFSAFLNAIDSAYKDADRRNRTMENIVTVTTAEAESEVESIKNAINEASFVAVLNKNGKVTAFNNNLQKLTGLSSKAYCNIHISNIISSDQQHVLEGAREKLEKGSSWQGEIQFTASSGMVLWLSGTASPLKNAEGKTTRIIVILHDITSRKLYEEEIINSEKKYRSVLNNIKEVVFQTDLNGEWTFLNTAWEDITSFKIADTLGKSILPFIYPADIDIFKQKFNEVLNDTPNQERFVINICHKTGNHKRIEVSLRPIISQKGIITGVSGIMHDITEKSKNLELLSKSYAFQKAILDSARQGILTTDLSGNIITFNKGGVQLFDISEDRTIIDQHISHFIKCEIFQSSDHLFDLPLNKIQEKIQDEIECKVRKSENNYINALLSISEIKDEQQNTTGYLFIISDNSKRKKAEEEVYKLNTILEESPDYVSYYDMEDRLLYANRAYKTLRNYPLNDNEPDLYPPWAELIIKKKAIPFAIKHGSWKGETAIYDQNRNEIPVLQLIIIHKDESGNPVFRSSISRDITHRKSYEHKLLQSEKRNRDLVNYSQAIICTHDMQGRILSINPSGTALLGYSMEELIGIKISDLMPKEYQSLFNDNYLKSFETGRVAEGILYLLDKNNKQVSLLYKNYKVDEPGENSYVIGFAQDISERLRAENELKTAKLAAEESAKAKELFLANMSHEIRTPMNGIVGLTNLLIKTQLSDKQKEYACSVKHSAESLLVVINDILDFSKIQAGKLELEKMPFEIGNLLYNIRQTFKIEAHKKHIEFSTILDDQLPKVVVGDVNRINQVLVNLISNAIKFTENGKVTLSSKLITKGNEACRIQFNVEDTGIGIQKEKLEKIFNSFTQANSDTSRKYGGTGLGLTIVKNLLDLMGSSIKVYSLPDKGSTFSFELNLENYSLALNSLPEAEEENHAGKLKGVRILLAEDNKVNQLFASEILSEWGVEHDIADNGKIALEYLVKNKYDLVLMDIQMPEMDGIEATHIIRNEFAIPLRNIPIIAMTANAMKGDESKFKMAGMNNVIFKPYQANELFHVIRKQLGNDTLDPNENNLIKSPLSTYNQPDEGPTLVHANLSTLKAFSRGKDQFIIRMISTLIDSVPPTLEELDKAIQIGDWTSVSKYSHKLIPNMNMMGNATLESEMKWIENNSDDYLSQIHIIEKWGDIKRKIKLTISELENVNSYYLAKVTNIKN